MGNLGSEAPAAETRADSLAPYLPRVVVEWLRDAPSARHRALTGTMAFVDVSGFTAMSERLAPKGRLGAEEVTDVMSATFAQLLAIAYDNGGGLVKFGGDALLLFFDGDEHAKRACSAAWGMRDRLAAMGPLPTSAGPVELKMHVGIHSGTFDFFLVGSRHRELIVGGPAAARTVEMEDTAEAGEIAVSTETVPHLDAADLGETKGEGVLLAAAPAAALTGIARLPESGGLDLLGCIPESLRVHLGGEKVESEHRRAAVAFVRFAGELDEDNVGEVIDVLQEACAAHGVCFLESDIDAKGGRVVLVAGVPTTAGEDEERLLRTVRTAVDAETRLPLHVGVATGGVFTGRIGPTYRRTFTILGGTAALAARLMAKANAREIWTTPDLLERSGTVFETTPVGALTLKGKAAPVEAVSVGAITAGRTAPARARKLPLVDRQRELPVLDAALVPVKMGFGSFVELVGDAGIGKSRIIEELCDRAGDLPVVTAACEQYETTTPYFPFRKLLGDVLRVELTGDVHENTHMLGARLSATDPELLPWLPLVADVLDAPVLSTRETDELDPSFRRARLHGVVEQLLSFELDAPTVLLFEDSHWMDEASSDLLRHLGTRVQSKPWLVCSTRRPTPGGFVAAEGTPAVPALSLRLDPLPEEDAKALAVSAAPDDLPADQLAAITARAGGNPLFVQELVAATHGHDDVSVLPESVEAVVTSRIDSLAPGDRALLRWASVLGASFSGSLVGRVIESDPDASFDAESWDRLAEFVERDPYSAGSFRFRHALIRDAAYEGLSFRRRRELHARVGEVLQATAGEDDAATLSLHFSLADRPGETWIYSLVAADNAKAMYANADAAELYRRALAAAEREPDLPQADVAHAWESLGDVLTVAWSYDDADGAYERARELLHADSAALAGLCGKEGELAELQGHYADALAWFERGLALVEDDAGALLPRLRLQLDYAGVRFRQGNLDDCVDWCKRTIDNARGAGALKELAHAYGLLYVAYTWLGDPERRNVRDLALPIYEEIGDLKGQADTLNNLGIDAYYEGRWQDALELYERSRRLRERIGDVVGAALIANNIAEVFSDQGRLAEAETVLYDVIRTAEAAGSKLLAFVARGNLGRAAARAGRNEEGRGLLEQSLASLREIDAAAYEVELSVRLGEAAILVGDHARALELCDAESDTPTQQALIHRVRAYAFAQAGRRDEAATEIDRSLAVARESSALYEVGLSLRARSVITGNVGDRTESDGLLATLDVVFVPDVPL